MIMQLDSSSNFNLFPHITGLDLTPIIFNFSKDMWSSSAGDSASRSSVAGLAFLSEVCQSFRYSICEEEGGFASINTAAHEIGHK